STLQPDGTYTYLLESTSGANDIAAPVKGYAILDSNLQLSITNYNVIPSYFSPNGDTIQDATTASATFNVSVNWTLNIKNYLNAIVRSATGSGTSMSYLWDGKDSAGVLQPDGVYTFELLVGSGELTSGQTKTVALDIIPAVGTISYPTGNLLWSNVNQNGNMNLVITGTISDLNLQNWTLDYGAGASPSSWSSLSSGTTAITNGTIYTWSTSNLAGPYTLRLQVWDKAGNKTVTLVTFTVGHFRALLAVLPPDPFEHEFNRNAGETQMYFSIIPFTLTETITIKNGSGQTVRTLIENVSRPAGNYPDYWDGKNDAGVFVPDGPYFYYATVSDG
ncbi:MAG: hypothetical protein L0287_34415, partial [Anaerolineae bacterium]|nr:hypothetical protein [Anaerolineae bacterium]